MRMNIHVKRMLVGISSFGVLIAFIEAFAHSGIVRSICIGAVILAACYFLGMFVLSELEDGYRGVC